MLLGIVCRPVGSGWGACRAQAPNNFENNGAKLQALIRYTVLYCFKNNSPPISSFLQPCIFEDTPSTLALRNALLDLMFLSARMELCSNGNNSKWTGDTF